MPPYQFFKNSQAINKNKLIDSEKGLFQIKSSVTTWIEMRV